MNGKRKISATLSSLDQFFDIVDQSLLVFEEGVKNYLHRDMLAITGNLQNIVKLQNEASILSREIQTALFTNSFSFSLQGDIYRLLEQMSHIIDMLNNNLFQFEIERPAIPSELNQDFLKLMELSSEAVVNTIKASRSYFNAPENIQDMVRRVYFYQKEADRQAKSLKKRVFQQMQNLKLSEKTHLRYFALHIEEISLQAMKVVDQLSVMSIRNNASDFRSRPATLFLSILASILTGASLVLFIKGETNGMSAYIAGLAVVLLIVIAVLWISNRRIRRKALMRLKAQEDEISTNNRKVSDMEVKIISMENDHLQNLLEMKRKEATGIAEKISEQKEFLNTIYEMVLEAEHASDGDDRSALLHELKTKLSLRNNFSDEKDFYSQVELLHKDFNARLSARFPQLTPQERKLATLLRLGFSSKYIANLLDISTKSVEVERHRIRRKMNLERGSNLTEFIKTI